MKSQRHLVEASLADTHQHDVSPRKSKRQKVDIDMDQIREAVREVVREEVRNELERIKDRRSGSGD